MSNDGLRNVVEQEQRAREQRLAQEKGHGTKEMYRLEQDAAREGHFHGEAQPPGLVAKIKQAIMGLFGRG
jgi:hypothetical protein